MDSYSLRSVNDLPQLFQSVFGFRYFNSLQSECFPVCFLSDVNMVISAPTGSGKTVLFELCTLRLLSMFLAADGRFSHAKGTLKTIYIAHSKALVQEKLRHWNQNFVSWGVVCLELTSDNETYSTKHIQEADIILTTPEKFDAVSRFSINGMGFFSDIALVLIDEVHLLNDPRGAALEAKCQNVETNNVKMSIKPSLNSISQFPERRPNQQCQNVDEPVLRDRPRRGDPDQRGRNSVGGGGRKHGLAMGADRAIHVESKASLYPLAVAKLLRALVKIENPRLVILGKQAINDGCLAGHKGHLLQSTDLRLNQLRYATLPSIMKAKSKPIKKTTPDRS